MYSLEVLYNENALSSRLSFLCVPLERSEKGMEFIMNSCAFVNFISLLACEIAKDKSQEEIEILAAFFTQLGDTLATLSALNNN